MRTEIILDLAQYLSIQPHLISLIMDHLRAVNKSIISFLLKGKVSLYLFVQYTRTNRSVYFLYIFAQRKSF